MAWQIVSINNPAKLSLKDNNIVINQNGLDYKMPIEYIDAVILDSHINITTALISKLSESNVCVLVCNEKHLPKSIILPNSSHSRQAKVTKLHMSLSEPFKKRLWQNIIKAKIKNQSDVLEYFSYDNSKLVDMLNEVKSGDKTNREALAARIYFSKLLDDETRRKPMWYNSALNYGYAIVRSQIAKHIASRGLISSLGIFHHSELNQFNLADDIIEPYRPIVDKYVIEKIRPLHINEDDKTLTLKDRKLLIDILNKYVIIKSKKYRVNDAIGITVDSLVDSMKSKDPNKILLPIIY